MEFVPINKGGYRCSRSAGNGCRKCFGGGGLQSDQPGHAARAPIEYPGGLNSAGQVVGYANDTSGNGGPFLYSNGTVAGIATPGVSFFSPQGINDAGQVVGNGANSSGVTNAYLWTSGAGIQDLGDFQPWESTIAARWREATTRAPRLDRSRHAISGQPARHGHQRRQHQRATPRAAPHPRPRTIDHRPPRPGRGWHARLRLATRKAVRGRRTVGR